MKKNIALVDLDTGDLLDSVPMLVPMKVKCKEFVMMWQSGFMALANEKLTGEQMRVLCFLLATLDYENYIILSGKTIAEALELQPSHVSRAMKVLVEKKILSKGEKFGNTYTYRLNPFYGWRGKARNKKKMVEEMEAADRRQS